MRAKLLLAAGAACLSFAADAVQLGAYGTVWDIAERDVPSMIKSKLAALQKDGTLDRVYNQWREGNIRYMQNPTSVSWVKPAKEARARLIDPTVALPEAVLDGNGNTLVPAGTRINPLEHMRLSRTYVFFDAREPAQVAFAERHIKQNPNDVLILVGGDAGNSWIENSKKLKHMVYFDQHGMLSKRFQLERSPSILKQDGLKLRITEVAL